MLSVSNQPPAIGSFAPPGIANLDGPNLNKLYCRLENIKQGHAVLRMLPDGDFILDAPQSRHFSTSKSDTEERRRAAALFEGGNRTSVTVSSARDALIAAMLSKCPHIPNVDLSLELASTFGAKVSVRAGDGRAVENVFEIDRGVLPKPPRH